MAFVNPLDALGMNPNAPPSYEELRVAKRRRALEFQLADGIEVNGVHVSRADFDRATSDLDDDALIKGYHALRRHSQLNGFLTTGDVGYFDSPPPCHEDAQAIARAVGSSYASAYGEALASAVRAGEAGLVTKMARAPRLYGRSHEETAQRPVDDALAHIEREVADVCKRVRNGDADAKEAAVDITFDVRPGALNALPMAFGTGRNQIAQAVRNLGVAAINDGDDPDAAYQIMSLAAGLDVPDEAAEDIEKQLATVRAIRDRRRLTSEYASALTKAAESIDELEHFRAEAERGAKHAMLAGLRAKYDIDYDLINSLPEELEEVRVQIAYALRNLSVAVWNSSQTLRHAKGPLVAGLSLSLPAEVRGRLQGDLEELESIAEANMKREKREVAILGGVLLQLRAKTSHVKGYETNWSAVSDMMSKLLGSDNITLLVAAHDHSPDDVDGVIRAALPFIAGLHKYSPTAYGALCRRLAPLVKEDDLIERMVSPAGLAGAVQTDTDVKRMTSDKEIWQHGWFWWAIFFALVILFGL